MQIDAPLSRRRFLKVAAIGTAAAFLSRCAPFPGASPTSGPANYYLANERRIRRDLDGLLQQVRRLTTQSYGETAAAAILEQAERELVQLLPQLPYIGGDGNSLTQTLCQAAAALAFYRAMKAQGRPVAEAGRIVYRTTEALVSRPDPLRGVDSRAANSKAMQSEFKRMAAESQKRAFPGDWVSNFVPGDGLDFDWGVDYTECGICKLFHAQGADEMAPYLCLGDFPVSQAYGTGLVRTTTLARGGPRCDFRYKSGRPIQMDWEPDFLKGGQ